MFAQTIGFGTDAAGLKAFAGSANTLGDLSDRYIGEAFSLLISFTAVVGAFGCHMATGAISGRLLYAFARDGLGPPALARIDLRTGSPQRASWSVVVVAVVVSAVSGSTLSTTGSAATSTYFVFGVAGSVCLMICYLLVELAALWFTAAPRFAAVHAGGRTRGRSGAAGRRCDGDHRRRVVQREGCRDWRDPPMLGLYWCALGAVIALGASGIAGRVGQSLAAEVELLR